jgi:hypothetical protein
LFLAKLKRFRVRTNSRSSSSSMSSASIVTIADEKEANKTQDKTATAKSPRRGNKRRATQGPQEGPKKKEGRMKHRKCFNCGTQGHMFRQCPRSRQEQNIQRKRDETFGQWQSEWRNARTNVDNKSSPGQWRWTPAPRETRSPFTPVWESYRPHWTRDFH